MSEALPSTTKVVDVSSADACASRLIVVAPAKPAYGVLWLPALGVSARHYQAFAGELAAHGAVVALHEARGIGSSTLRASRQVDWGYREILEADIPASLAAARALHPGLRWVIAGHSIGGQFATLFAALHPHEFSALVLIASGSPYWRTFARPQRWLMRLLGAVVATITAVCGYYPGRRLGFAGNEARRLMRDWARTSSSGRYALPSITVDLEAALHALALPVQGIRMHHDRLCPPASLEWLFGKMPAAALERVVLGDQDFSSGRATHFSWMRDSAPVARCFHAFAARQLAGTC